MAEFQKLFLETWQRQKGASLSERNYFPDLKAEGNALVRAVGSSPGQSNRLTFVVYVSAITFAEHSLHLTNAYFVPDDETVESLSKAASRGVDVKLDQLTVAETMPEGAVKILVAIADVDAIVRQGMAIDDHDWQNKKAGEKQASTGNRSATGEKEGGTANSATP